MPSSPPARFVLLAIALLAAVIGPAPARGDTIDFFRGTYAHLSGNKTTETDGTATSTFFLRDPANFIPSAIQGVSEIQVVLLPVGGPGGNVFPVKLTNPATGGNDFQVTTSLGTTTFDFSAPEDLVEVTGPTDLLLVSGLTLPSATDPAFSDYVHSNGAFLAALQGVTLNLPTGAGTPTVTFLNKTSSAPFLVLVPEPASMFAWLLCGGGAWLWRKRRRAVPPAGAA